MKLIDLLVQELPKRGGWPEKACLVVQDPSGYVCFSISQQPVSFNDTWVGGDWLPSANFYADAGRADDNKSAIITRSQYEAALAAALAAAQQPAWNGEGLPPIGCECEYLTNLNGPKRIKIECVTKDGVAFTWMDNAAPFSGLDCVCIGQALEYIRPILSEADKKRDAIIESLAYHTNAADAADLYKAIEAGEVEGVKLDV